MTRRRVSARCIEITAIVGVLLSTGSVGEATATSPGGVFGSRITVHEVQIPVVVRRHGVAVSDLRRGEFRVTEDGEVREVLSARRVVEGKAAQSLATVTRREEREPRESAKQHILLAFDDSIDRLPILTRALDDVRKWIEEQSGSGTEWAIVLIGEEPRLLLPFSSRVGDVNGALDSLVRLYRGERVKFDFDTAILAPMHSQNGAQAAAAQRGPSQTGLLEQFVEGTSERAQAASKARSAIGLRQVLLALSGVSGTKAMVLFYSSPGPDDHDVSVGLSATQVRAWGNYLQSWSDTADVAVSTGFRVYATDVRGLNPPHAPPPGGRSEEVVHNGGIPAKELEKSIAGMLAVRTGGRRLELNDYSEILRQSKRDLEDYYALSVEVPHGYDGQHHQWRVKVDRPGVEVRYPRSYVDLSPRAKLVAELQAPATLPKTGGRLQSRVRIVKTARRGDHEAVSVEAGVLARQVGLVPSEGGGREGALEVFVATYAPAGTPLTLDAKRETFRLRGSGDLGNRTLTINRTVKLPSSGGTVAVGFYDPVDGGTALRAVRVATGK